MILFPSVLDEILFANLGLILLIIFMPFLHSPNRKPITAMKTLRQAKWNLQLHYMNITAAGN